MVGSQSSGSRSRTPSPVNSRNNEEAPVPVPPVLQQSALPTVTVGSRTFDPASVETIPHFEEKFRTFCLSSSKHPLGNPRLADVWWKQQTYALGSAGLTCILTCRDENVIQRTIFQLASTLTDEAASLLRSSNHPRSFEELLGLFGRHALGDKVRRIASLWRGPLPVDQNNILATMEDIRSALEEAGVKLEENPYFTKALVFSWCPPVLQERLINVYESLSARDILENLRNHGSTTLPLNANSVRSVFHVSSVGHAPGLDRIGHHSRPPKSKWESDSERSFRPSRSSSRNFRRADSQSRSRSRSPSRNFRGRGGWSGGAYRGSSRGYSRGHGRGYSDDQPGSRRSSSRPSRSSSRHGPVPMDLGRVSFQEPPNEHSDHYSSVREVASSSVDTSGVNPSHQSERPVRQVPRPVTTKLYQTCLPTLKSEIRELYKVDGKECPVLHVPLPRCSPLVVPCGVLGYRSDGKDMRVVVGALVDSGADDNFVSHDIVMALRLEMSRPSSPSFVRVANGDLTEVVGTVRLSIHFGPNTGSYRADFRVMKLGCDLILGCPFLTQTKARIDFDTSRMSLAKFSHKTEHVVTVQGQNIPADQFRREEVYRVFEQALQKKFEDMKEGIPCHRMYMMVHLYRMEIDPNFRERKFREANEAYNRMAANRGENSSTPTISRVPSNNMTVGVYSWNNPPPPGSYDRPEVVYEYFPDESDRHDRSLRQSRSDRPDHRPVKVQRFSRDSFASPSDSVTDPGMAVDSNQVCFFPLPPPHSFLPLLLLLLILLFLLFVSVLLPFSNL
jgi:hypothetical protein